MTIFPYIKVTRKGILYPQEINKPFLFTDFHVPTNRVPPTPENAILFFPQNVGYPFFFFFFLISVGQFTSTTQFKKKNTNKQNNCYFRIETKQKK